MGQQEQMQDPLRLTRPCLEDRLKVRSELRSPRFFEVLGLLLGCRQHVSVARMKEFDELM